MIKLMNEKTVETFSGKVGLLVLGHFVIDLYPAFLPPLLPVLME